MSDDRLTIAADVVRRSDADAVKAVEAAFRAIPRPALLKILDIAGVMKPRPPEGIGLERNGFENGLAFLALEILTRAGFDSVSGLVGAITGSLEGDHHERPRTDPGAITDTGPDARARAHAGPGAYAEPNPDY